MKNLITILGVALFSFMVIGFRHQKMPETAVDTDLTLPVAETKKPEPVINTNKRPGKPRNMVWIMVDQYRADDATLQQSGTARMLRKADWKLVYDMQGSGQLYHLTTDPKELTNLFGNPKYLVKQDELLRYLMAWELRMQNRLAKGNLK